MRQGAVRKATPKAVTLGRAPKQLRSRESFERVIQAATAILRETGHADFTLSEVSRRSRTSIGSIYGRVESKEELVRVVQHRVFEQVDSEFAEVVNKIRRRSLPLRQLVPVLVRDLAEMLRSYGNIFSAMIETSAHDPQVAATGKRHYAEQALDFKLLLLERRSEIAHPDPEHAATFAFALVYGMIARHLGFGTRDAAGEGDWRQLVDDLGTTCLALLLIDPGDHRPTAR